MIKTIEDLNKAAQTVQEWFDVIRAATLEDIKLEGGLS